jgi:SAM-dependent methyltransferase
VGDGHALGFEREFDAVFSNAALHWLLEPDAAIASVARALRPGGRFVAEFGGHGCVAAVRVAIHSVLEEAGIEPGSVGPWYFPTDREYAQRLRRAGFVVTHIELIPRPTPLPTGIEGWLATFAKVQVAALPESEREAALARMAARLRPVLYDATTGFTADYVRLRVVASLPGSG